MAVLLYGTGYGEVVGMLEDIGFEAQEAVKWARVLGKVPGVGLQDVCDGLQYLALMTDSGRVNALRNLGLSPSVDDMYREARLHGWFDEVMLQQFGFLYNDENDYGDCHSDVFLFLSEGHYQEKGYSMVMAVEEEIVCSTGLRVGRAKLAGVFPVIESSVVATEAVAFEEKKDAVEVVSQVVSDERSVLVSSDTCDVVVEESAVASAEGYCYSAMFASSMRVQVSKALGKEPLMASVMVDYIAAIQTGSALGGLSFRRVGKRLYHVENGPGVIKVMDVLTSMARIVQRDRWVRVGSGQVPLLSYRSPADAVAMWGEVWDWKCRTESVVRESMSQSDDWSRDDVVLGLCVVVADESEKKKFVETVGRGTIIEKGVVVLQPKEMVGRTYEHVWVVQPPERFAESTYDDPLWCYRVASHHTQTFRYIRMKERAGLLGQWMARVDSRMIDAASDVATVGISKPPEWVDVVSSQGG